MRPALNVEPLKTRLLENSMPISESGCWIWLGTTRNETKRIKSYGQIRVDHKTVHAHRLSYQVFNGKIPHHLQVLHKCDIPSCINPKHLFLGTQKDNVSDCIQKGRFKGFIKKMHCVKGHKLFGENVYVRKDGARQCVICRRNRSREWMKSYRRRNNEAIGIR